MTIFHMGRISMMSNKKNRWRSYSRDMLIFNGIGFLILFLILIFQDSLPLNPQKFGSFNLSFAINTASSFVTNTNWQVYSGETAASYFTQMAGLTVHNFLSAATGICIAIAVMRGITRHLVEDLFLTY
jgi:potassium-transporting ATPase potassium-binding subunit